MPKLAATRYSIALKQYAVREPKKKKSIRAQTSIPKVDLADCPYQILRAQYPQTTEEWKVWKTLDKDKVLLFFLYESWLRSPTVWQYFRDTNRGQQPILSRRKIGSIPVHFLSWLLSGGHHRYVFQDFEANGSGIIDLAERLRYFGKGLTTTTGQRLLKDKLAILTSTLIEHAAMREENKEVPTDLYVKIDATKSLASLLQALSTVITDRQTRMCDSFLAADVITQRWAATKQSGPPYDWKLWEKRLHVWDLKNQSSPMTFEKIGQELSLAKDYSAHASRAGELYAAADEMIRQAATGTWPPNFPRRGARHKRTVHS